jgi:citrate lyase beta subunit
VTAAAFQPRRSLIFAPGDKPEMLAKAAASGADMACLDLEDAVAPQHKAAARERTLALFASGRSGSPAADGVERIVRINPLRSAEGMKDVAALVAAPASPPALMLTKVRTADEVKLLDEVLSEAQMPTRLHVIVETNDALENAMAIGRASARIDSLLFGAVDLTAELRATYGWEPLLYARARVVNAAAAAGLDLVDVPWLDLADMDGMRREAEQSRALGFTGKGAIHPKQIAPLNEIFTPKPEDVARARRIVSAFAAAGTGLVVIDGKLIERPVLRAMNRLVAVADAIGKR